MSDIDFDELDKAVGSLMQAANKPVKAPMGSTEDEAQQDGPSPVADKAQGDVLDMSMIDSVGATPPEPAEAEASAEEEPSRANVARAAAPVSDRPSISVKRRGQFMDVMHSSANMKTPSEAAAETAKATPSRQGVSLQPTGLVSPNPVAPPDVADPDTERADTDAMVGVSAIESEDAWSGLPDMADDQDVDENPVGAIDFDNKLIDEAADSLVTSMAEEGTNPNSPFLPDTKVEKRPLGMVDAVNESEEEPHDHEEEFEDDSEYSSGSELDKSDLDDDDELPIEFDATLVSLEADDTAAIATAETSIGIVPPKIEYDDNDTASSVQKPSLGIPPSPLSASPALPSRTPTEAVDAGIDEDVSSSIFDTASGDLGANSRHTSSWYTVVIFAGMVMIGVLCAVVYYFVSNGA